MLRNPGGRLSCQTDAATQKDIMYRRILVPVDGSPTSRRGLEAAIQMAILTGATVRLIHVIDELVFATGFEPAATYEHDVLPRIRRNGARVLEEARTLLAAAGIAVDTVLSECFARRTADVILDAAKDWNADLVVIGTHGRRGINRLLLGSDAEDVLRRASVPVLLVRGDDEPPPCAVVPDSVAVVADSAL
jgi:nucleotide-binding universal stress UspA family protein